MNKIVEKRTKEQIKEKSRKYYLKHREEIIEKNKLYRFNNIENEIIKDKIYYDKNRETILNKKKIYNKKNSGQQKQYRLEHIDEKKEYNKNYYRNRVIISDDKLFKLIKNIRSLIRISLINGGYKKNGKTENILGCTFEEFKQYIESKFEPWMNWNNYGNWNGYPNKINVAWDIDHKIPLSTATNEDELIKLNHYTNLQPLCSYYNRHIKFNKI